jgi:C1A family cysteine protease
MGAGYKCPTEADVYDSIVPVLDTSFDWRDHGVGSPVHEQGAQGKGFVHAAVTAIEQAYLVKFKTGSKRFSTQQPLDCLPSQASQTPGDVFKYVRVAGGLATAEGYPFTVE